MVYLFAAYAVVVIALGAYVVVLARRQREVAAELAALEAELAARQEPASAETAPQE